MKLVDAGRHTIRKPLNHIHAHYGRGLGRVERAGKRRTAGQTGQNVSGPGDQHAANVEKHPVSPEADHLPQQGPIRNPPFWHQGRVQFLEAHPVQHQPPGFRHRAGQHQTEQTPSCQDKHQRSNCSASADQRTDKISRRQILQRD